MHHVRNTGGFILQPSSTTLATILQQQGWDTAAFISSAVLKKLFGLNQGFAVYDDQMPKPGNSRDFLDDPERRAGDTVDRALRWLDGQSGKPYFLWVHLYDPHMPYQPPSPFKEKYKDRPYDGEIAYADRELGRLFEAVRKKSPADKTILAVLSDHGESLGEHGEYSHGIFLYDATLRIAFLMSGPGIPAGMRVKQQARTIDFVPTVLDLMGGKAPASVQGASLTPALTGHDPQTAVSYAETLYPKINMGWAELRAIRTNHWKYVRAPKPELYDLPRTRGNHQRDRCHRREVHQFDAQLKALTTTGGPEGVFEAGDRRTMEQLKSWISVRLCRAGTELTGKGKIPRTIPQAASAAVRPGSGSAGHSSRSPHQPAPERLTADPANPTLYFSLGGEYERLAATIRPCRSMKPR